MFIVCPSCSGPYRIPADQIAPLVQTACPHCEYRIILDFEAANEPSLREAGQQFAQGFESIEAYASVYDHVTSKPGAQPRLGVTSVTRVQADAKPQVAAAAAAARPLQRPEPSTPGIATPIAAASTSGSAPIGTPEPAAASTGSRHKTVLQVPSKKPVSMEPKIESASISGVTAAAVTSMRAGKGVDVVEPKVEEPKVEARTQPASEPSAHKPPHTPPTTAVVSSAPPASETPTPVPEDITAASGKHAVVAQPAEIKPTETKPAEPPSVPKPPEPAGSNAIIYIIILVIIGGVIAMVLMNR